MSEIQDIEKENPLETFWIGDLPEQILFKVLERVLRGTCWADGVSGAVEKPELLESLQRLKLGLPAKKGDRLLKVVCFQTEMMIAMEDEVDGLIPVKHWTGNGKGMGWAAKPLQVPALEARRDMIDDMQIITLVLHAIDHLNETITFDARGQRLCTDRQKFYEARRKFYEQGDVSAIDGMLEMFETYLTYEGGRALSIPKKAAETNVFPWEDAVKFLNQRHGTRIEIIKLAEMLLVKFRSNLESRSESQEDPEIGGRRRRVQYDCLQKLMSI